MNLETAIAEYRGGKVSAFDDIYQATHRIVYFRILYLVREKATAEDLLQDTYVRAMRSLDRYEPGTNFLAWLVKIGRNLALNHLERAKRETLTDLSEESKLAAPGQESGFLFELARKVLSEEEYEIVMLCQVAGYKRREIAKLFSMPLPTVTWKNNQALKKLRRCLKEEELR